MRSPQRFSISAWPRRASRASMPGPRLHARPLAIESGLGIARRSMRRVRTGLAAEVGLVIAASGRRRLVAARDGLDALHRRPCLDHRAIDAEVISGQQALYSWLREQR